MAKAQFLSPKIYKKPIFISGKNAINISTKKYHSSHVRAVKSVWLCSKFKNSWTIFLFYLVLNRRVEFHSWRRNINQPISKLKSVLQWGLGSVTPVSSGRKTTTTWKRGLQWDLDRWIKMGDWKIKTTPGKLNIL